MHSPSSFNKRFSADFFHSPPSSGESRPQDAGGEGGLSTQ